MMFYEYSREYVFGKEADGYYPFWYVVLIIPSYKITKLTLMEKLLFLNALIVVID